MALDPEEVERRLDSIMKMCRKFTEFMISNAEVGRLEGLVLNSQHKIKESQANVLNEHAAELDRLNQGLKLMNEVVQRQHETNLALCRMLEAKGIDTSHLKVV